MCDDMVLSRLIGWLWLILSNPRHSLQDSCWCKWNDTIWLFVQSLEDGPITTHERGVDDRFPANFILLGRVLCASTDAFSTNFPVKLPSFCAPIATTNLPAAPTYGDHRVSKTRQFLFKKNPRLFIAQFHMLIRAFAPLLLLIVAALRTFPGLFSTTFDVFRGRACAKNDFQVKSPTCFNLQESAWRGASMRRQGQWRTPNFLLRIGDLLVSGRIQVKGPQRR